MVYHQVVLFMFICGDDLGRSISKFPSKKSDLRGRTQIFPLTSTTGTHQNNQSAQSMINPPLLSGSLQTKRLLSKNRSLSIWLISCSTFDRRKSPQEVETNEPKVGLFVRLFAFSGFRTMEKKGISSDWIQVTQSDYFHLPPGKSHHATEKIQKTRNVLF